MAGTGKRRLLVVIWEAAEKALVQRLLDEGRLPTLSVLVDDGGLLDVEGPHEQLTGALWPTFVTGTEPEVHGAISEWRWHPDEMRLRRYSGADLRPFWTGLSAQGLSIGLVDVPFEAPGDVGAGFRVIEWGAHDRFLGRTVVQPDSVLPVVARHPKHPFAGEPRRPVREDDVVGLARIAERCHDGLGRRTNLVLDLLRAQPVDLAIVAFPELHAAGHVLWHTLDAADHGMRDLDEVVPDLYASADRQLARLLGACGTDTAVLVMSFHGMRQGGGRVTLLEPLLADIGVTTHPAPAAPGRSRALASLLPLAKKTIPESARWAYRRGAPFALQLRVAELTSTVPYDWARTEAFSMCRDHPDWVRINLAGREREGIVPAEAFKETRDAIVAGLLSKRSPSGAPLIDGVVCPTEVPHRYLPDLLVSWGRAAYEQPARVAGTEIAEWPLARHLTGQHRTGGWAVGRPPLVAGKLRLAGIGALCADALGVR
jgi:predicted AlkP superfamily phosphohydrolase/phosphomutase